MTTERTINDVAWQELAALVSHYPSPHNGQPIKLKVISGTNVEVYFDTERGLFASELGLKFSYLTVGVFMEVFMAACEALGHDARYTPSLTQINTSTAPYLHYFGSISINFNTQTPNPARKKTITSRHTYRGEYDDFVANESFTSKLQKIAKNNGQTLLLTHDQEQVRNIIWLNQKKLFEDLGDTKLRQELAKWLRYTKHQAQTKRDGLSALCLQIPGIILKSAIKFHSLLTKPFTQNLFKKFYLSNMKNTPCIVWLKGPFSTYEDYLNAGQTFMKVWFAISDAGYFIHPYGTIPTHATTVEEFLSIVQDDADPNTVWMIFRMGKRDNAEVPKSYRLPSESLFIESES